MKKQSTPNAGGTSFRYAYIMKCTRFRQVGISVRKTTFQYVRCKSNAANIGNFSIRKTNAHIFCGLLQDWTNCIGLQNYGGFCFLACSYCVISVHIVPECFFVVQQYNKKMKPEKIPGLHSFMQISNSYLKAFSLKPLPLRARSFM